MYLRLQAAPSRYLGSMTRCVTAWVSRSMITRVTLPAGPSRNSPRPPSRTRSLRPQLPSLRPSRASLRPTAADRPYPDPRILAAAGQSALVPVECAQGRADCRAQRGGGPSGQGGEVAAGGVERAVGRGGVGLGDHVRYQLGRAVRLEGLGVLSFGQVGVPDPLPRLRGDLGGQLR